VLDAASRREIWVNFDLTEDQEMLKALAERFVGEYYDIERRRSYLQAAIGFSAENWSLLGELGLIASLFCSRDGGLDLDATGIATLFEALGKGLLVEPLIENVMVAGRLFAATAPQPLRDELLHKILTGECRLAFAHLESSGRPGLNRIEACAKASSDGVQLTGGKSCVPAGAGVDGYIVSARSDAGDVGLSYVPASTPGLICKDWRMADGSAATSLELDRVSVPAQHVLAGGEAEIEAAQLLGNLARCAEALGIMERLFSETLEHLRTREQFGQKLGSFQAVQHRMAGQYAVLEQCRGLLHLALVSDGTDGFASAVYGARAFMSDVALGFGHEMIQLHGGMGVTDELSIGHGHKRLLVLSRWPDSPELALDRFAGI
jgi:alkylation response protein AidB-like acyl-CoA dehydrogenase